MAIAATSAYLAHVSFLPSIPRSLSPCRAPSSCFKPANKRARKPPASRVKQRCCERHSARDIAFSMTRFCHRARATRIRALHERNDYEFREDGAELEVRVPLPSVEDAGRQLTARYVAVDAQATSLTVGVETIQGVQILLNASSLYGSIKPSETVWYVDETEVVLSLKKVDDELAWPDLVEAWESLARGVSTLLKGTSVYIVGESTEINWAVAQDIAASLEYVPLQTQQLIEHIAKASISEIIAEDGKGVISEIEEAVLNNLSQHVRCVVATLGGSDGAAAQYSRWNSLHSGFSVWLSQSQAPDEASAKEEVVRAKEAGSRAYPKADVVVALSGWDSTAVRPTAEGALRALKYLLVAEKDLPAFQEPHLSEAPSGVPSSGDSKPILLGEGGTPTLNEDQRRAIAKKKLGEIISNAQKQSQGVHHIRHSLGVDLGDSRTGIAISLKGYAPRALSVLQLKGDKLIENLLQIASKERADEIIVGLPISCDGKETLQSNKTRSFAGRLATQAAQRGWRVYLLDEYGSSQAGLDYMLDMGIKKKSRKEKLDAYAALVLLHSYFRSKGAHVKLVIPKGLTLQERLCLADESVFDEFNTEDDL